MLPETLIITDKKAVERFSGIKGLCPESVLCFYYSFKISNFCKATYTWDITSGRDVIFAITLVAQKRCETNADVHYK